MQSRYTPKPTEKELAEGVPIFLRQLTDILLAETRAAQGRAEPDPAMSSSAQSERLGQSASEHGADWLHKGFTVAQVIHDYGDICQVVTELAAERQEAISADEFGTFNRCLDHAIASAVTEYARCREAQEVERHGHFAHELRNGLLAALLAFQNIQKGRVGVNGSTMVVLERSLNGMRSIIDRSLSDVRVSSGLQQRQRLRLARVIEEVEVAAQLDAERRGVALEIAPVPYELVVDADPQLLASALSNLLQNAFKFTPRGKGVCLRTHQDGKRVLIEVEDECGGIPEEKAQKLFQPYEQAGADRSGLGLGLTITRKAVRLSGGEITLRNMPGRGCVFVVALPLAEGERSEASATPAVPFSGG